LGWSLSMSYQWSKLNLFPMRFVNNFWVCFIIILLFHPLWLVVSNFERMPAHLLTRGQHRLHRPFSVLQDRIEAPRGRCSLKLEANLFQKLLFFWSLPTIASVPMLIQARISRLSSSMDHFFAPPTTPPTTSSACHSLGMVSTSAPEFFNPTIDRVGVELLLADK